MTYTIAKMRIWNPECYTKEQLREAIVFILGTMGARHEDIDQASLLIACGAV